ncbi:cation-transporting ATPase [Trichonephila clavipes]|nr:cation-transporting ATPase [Trichonephila clavipes]
MKWKEDYQGLEGEENLKIQGFRGSYLKQVLTCIGVVLSCGLLWVIVSSKKRFYMHCTHYECSLMEAEKVFLVDTYGQEYISKVKRPGGKLTSSQTSFFYYKKMKYCWDAKEEKFVNVAGLNIQVCSELLSLSKGLHSEEARKRLQFYGPNSMRVEVTPVITLLLREAAVAEWYRYRIVACLVTSSSPVPLKTRRVGHLCTLNLSRAETSSRWCGVVVMRGGCQLRCRPRHLTMVQNDVVRLQKPSCS